MSITTSTLVKRHSAGGIYNVMIGIGFTNTVNYPAGGEFLDIRTIAGLTDKKPDIGIITGGPVSVGYTFLYDRSNNKVMIIVPAGTELPAGAIPAAVINDTDIRALFVYVTVPRPGQ